MDNYVQLPDTDEGDFGGVHINSGIPNKAFYLAAIGVGGFAWEAPGHIWYESLRASSPTTQFQDFADTTYMKAGQLYGAGGVEQQAVVAPGARSGFASAALRRAQGQGAAAAARRPKAPRHAKPRASPVCTNRSRACRSKSKRWPKTSPC